MTRRCARGVAALCAASTVLLRVAAFDVLARTPPPAATQAPAPGQDAEFRARIRALTARLDYRDNDPADRERYDRERDAVTANVVQLIDEYIETVVSTGETSVQVQRRLQTLLRLPNPLYADGPFTKIVELPAGRALIVAYTIVRPPHNDLGTIRAYMPRAGRYAQVAHIGDDFTEFEMFKREVRSPVPNEFWLMAWGLSNGGNGSITRFRLYAFDGRSFRTVWSPEEMVNATVTFSDIGFIIDHFRRPDDAHDEYRITANGVVKQAP